MTTDDPFERLAALPELDAGLLRRIRAFFADASDDELFRINLVAWSAGLDLPLEPTIAHFLYLTHAGAVDLSWDAHCPRCNVVLERAGRLAGLVSVHRCRYCLRDVTPLLDDHFEVTFTPHPTLRAVDGAVRYRASANVEVYARETIAARGRRTIDVRIPDGVARVRICAWPPTTVHVVPVADAALRLPLRFGAGERVALPDTIAPGGAALEVVNQRDAPVTVLFEDHDMPAYRPDQREPRLTGLDVVSSPAFGALFGGDSLADTECVGLRDATIAFTDIRGSTALYQRIGEIAAYRLVREHFEVLFRAVHARHGTVVKTIGDAIMAVFRRPVDAAVALLDAQRQLGELNRRPGRPAEVVVRVGLHRGPCLAVTLNDRLDYFGTTVNQASRMEAACDGGELVMSAAVLDSPGVREACAGWAIEAFAGRFDGLPGEHSCYRLARPPRP